MAFTKYEARPTTRGKGYKGIYVTARQIHITEAVVREFIRGTERKAALLSFDKARGAIRIRLSSIQYKEAALLKRGHSYPMYITCTMALENGLPNGRYYLRSDGQANDKSGDYELIFKNV